MDVMAVNYNRHFGIVRKVVPWLVLAVVLLTVRGYFAEYRAAQQAKESVSASVEGTAAVKAPAKGATAKGKAPAAAPKAKTAATKAAPASTKRVTVLIDGLNFRSAPESDGKVISSLGQGQKLTLVSQQGSWLRVKDETGQIGWVSSNPRWVKVE